MISRVFSIQSGKFINQSIHTEQLTAATSDSSAEITIKTYVIVVQFLNLLKVAKA